MIENFHKARCCFLYLLKPEYKGVVRLHTNKDGFHNWLWKLTAILNEANIKADCLLPFPQVSAWLTMRFCLCYWCSNFILYMKVNTFECISIGRKHLESVYALTRGHLGMGYHIHSFVICSEDKNESCIPVRRWAALSKQAFMCSGWLAFDVNSRVWY